MSEDIIFVHDTSHGYRRLIENNFSKTHTIYNHKIKKNEFTPNNLKYKLSVLIINNNEEYEILKVLKERSQFILIGVKSNIYNEYSFQINDKILVFELRIGKKDLITLINKTLNENNINNSPFSN